MSEFYTVFAIEGDFRHFMDSDCGYLKYEGLSWDEAVGLCRISFRQGYQCVILCANKETIGL